MPCFSHLLVLVALADVALSSRLAYLLLPNASYENIDQPETVSLNRLNNNIEPAEENENAFTSIRTRIVQNPPDSLEVAVGSRVELQCQVAGHPPPQVYWITGNEPERQIQELTTRAQRKSNIVSTKWEGFSHVTSTYVIDCVKPEDQGLKYCVSVSNNKVAQSTATVLLVNNTKATECSSKSQPTVTMYSTSVLALEHSTVILPCRAAGQPTPYLFWLDIWNKTIRPSTHERYTVLPNGDLQITNLNLFEDRGDFTCKVQSGYTEKSVTTFLYPVLSSSKERHMINFL